MSLFSVILILISNVVFGQIDITNQDAYYRVLKETHNTVPNAEYLISNIDGTRIVKTIRESRVGTNYLHTDNSYIRYLDNTTQNYYILTSKGVNDIKWGFNRISDNNFTLKNITSNTYLKVVYRWFLVGVNNYEFDTDLDDNNSYFETNFTNNSEISIKSLSSDGDKYMYFNSNKVEFHASQSKLNLFRQLKLNLEDVYTTVSQSMQLDVLSETGGNITYQLLNNFNGSIINENGTNLVSFNRDSNGNINKINFINSGVIYLKAIVAQNGKIPSYTKTIRINIVGNNICAQTHFNDFTADGYNIDNAQNTTVTFPILERVFRHNGSIRLGAVTGWSPNKNGLAITKIYDNTISGTIKVEMDVAIHNLDSESKLYFGFVKGNNNQNNNLNFTTDYAYFKLDNKLNNNNQSGYKTVEYTFTGVPEGSRLKIVSRDGRVFIDNFRINCSSSDLVIWDGIPAKWSNNIGPDINSKAEIRKPFNGSLIAKELTIKSDLHITENKFFTISDKLVIGKEKIIVNGEEDREEEYNVVFDKGAYLDLGKDAIVEGNVSFNTKINYYRFDTRNFSSPVENQLISGNLNNGAFVESSKTRKFKLNPAGNWENSTQTYFISGQGVSIQRTDGNRFYTDQNIQPTPLISTFYGKPFNNKDYKLAIENPISNGYYSLGNPYTSPINIVEFLKSNTNILNEVKLWRNDNPWDSGNGKYLHEDLFWNYCTATGCSQYIEGNFVDVGTGFVGRIKPGYTTNLVNYKHEHKILKLSGVFSNSRNNEDLSKFNISLKKNGLFINSFLVGYSNVTSEEFDEGYDLHAENIAPTSIYIDDNNEHYVIITKDINNLTDVKVLLNIKNEGDYSLELSYFDGLFISNQDIFLIDKYENNIINLSETLNYDFNSASGNFADRFEIVYQNKNLNTLELENNKTIIYKDNNDFFVKAPIDIVSYQILDLNGSVISEKYILGNKIKLDKIFKPGVYIIKIILNDGSIVNKKIVN